MTLASGGLNGLTLNGESVGADGLGRLGGGSLGAAFALRDRELPETARHLDELARSLMERVEDPVADPTLGAAPALLTDGGARLDPAKTTGLALRIAVNPRVDPDRGGALTRLRDGVQATTPGPTGDATQIDRWLDALQAVRAPASGGRPGSAAALASAVTGDLGGRRLAAEEDESFANARWSTLKESELAQGVDSDRELQLLMQLEKAYAANARVISALDEMMQTVLEI
jgi:flagellar hook-associated protein 1 FlgK